MGRPRGAKNKPKGPVRRRQVALEEHEEFVPLLKKPVEVVGKMVDVPGEHWGDSAAARDRSKIYKCAVKDFSVAYKSSPEAVPAQAMLLTELGEDGHGGTSEDFWMLYPHPFLKFYYKTYPLECAIQAVNHLGAGNNPGPRHTGPSPDNEAGEECKEKQLDRTMTLQYVDFVSSTKIPAGSKMAGRMKIMYMCNIEETPGRKCGSRCTVYGRSTGPIFKLHIRRRRFGRKTELTTYGKASSKVTHKL